jgi:hypothetical protein
MWFSRRKPEPRKIATGLVLGGELGELSRVLGIE